MAPARFVSRRHHIGVAGENEMRLAASDLGEKIFDIRRAGRRELHAMNFEAAAREEVAEIGKRAGLHRCHRAAADERLCDLDRIGAFAHWRPASGSGPYRLSPTVPRRQPISTNAQIEIASETSETTKATTNNDASVSAAAFSSPLPIPSSPAGSK